MPNIRDALAANVRSLMMARPDLDTPAKLARAVRLSFGKKKGKAPSTRAIQYLLDRRPDAPAPGLDIVAGVAKALGREPWELLLDDAGRQAFLMRLIAASAVPDERLPAIFTRAPKPTRKP